MLTTWWERPLETLLEDEGLAGLPEHPFPTDGWSGARFSFLERRGERFIIKRTSPTTDWIAAATFDAQIREACLAAATTQLTRGAPPFPYLGAARDGDEAAILMPDLSAELIAWERPDHQAALGVPDLDRVLGALAQLHVSPWIGFLEPGRRPFPWCPLRERLLLTSRLMCERHRSSGIAAGVTSAERLLAGWDAFDRRAPASALRLVRDLTTNVEPLVAELARLPPVGLHGDLKFANVALGQSEDDVAFIDWQMTMVAPVAVELGWMLVSNSASLPETPDAVLERYRSMPGLADVVGDWEAQVDLACIVGLLLRGWRKGLDAERGATLASGVSAADDLAWWCTRAVEAAGRVL